MAAKRDSAKNKGEKPLILLALQGGGALAAFQVGAYRALAEAEYLPDWVSAISMGSVNAAIIAGNEPEARLKKMDQFWDMIASPFPSDEKKLGNFLYSYFNFWSYMSTIWFGERNLYWRRLTNPFFMPPGSDAATSLYSNEPLRSTLKKVVDFDLIKSGTPRLSLGSTLVKKGELVFFDNTRTKITPDHIMASGAFPAAYPGIHIEGDLYWDGGAVTNSPLLSMMRDMPKRDVIVFLVDLWSAQGIEPQTLEQANWRVLEIRYATQITEHLNHIKTQHNLHYHQAADKNDCYKIKIYHARYYTQFSESFFVINPYSKSAISKNKEDGYHTMKKVIASIESELREESLLAAEKEELCQIHLFENGMYTPPASL